MKIQIELSPYDLYRLDGATKEMMGEEYKGHDPTTFFYVRERLVSHIIRNWVDPNDTRSRHRSGADGSTLSQEGG